MEQLKKTTYFGTNVGPTIETLSFFNLQKSITLMKRLNKRCHQYSISHINNIFGSCRPVVFQPQFEQYKVIKGEDIGKFCIRILHLRGSLFLTLYSTNEIEIIDLATPDTKVIDSMQLELSDSGPVDMDFNGDESQIIVGARGDVGALVNMKTKTFQEFAHRLPHPLILVQFLRYFPSSSGHFFLMSKGGAYRAWNTDLRYMNVAQFHPSQYFSEFHRPLSNFEELKNDDKDTLEYHQVPQQTTVAFPIQGKDMKHQIVVYRYMGIDHPQNGVRVIFPVNQLIHCIKQVHTRYLAVSVGNELRIYDVPGKLQLRAIDTQQPFQYLAKASGLNFRAEFDMIAESFIGYSYKNFFECATVIDKGPLLEDFHFKSIQDLEAKHRRRLYQTAGKNGADAIVAACQYQTEVDNFLIVAPRAEQNTIIMYKLGLTQ